MNRRTVIWGTVILLAGVCVVVSVLLRKTERHDTLADRLYRRMVSETGHNAQIAAIALARTGDPRSLPKLNEIMQSEEHGMMCLAVEAIGAGRLNNTEALDILLQGARDNHYDRLMDYSLRSLESTGLASQPRAIAFLLERAQKDDDMALWCIDTLASVGPPVTDDLVRLFDKSKGTGTRRKKESIIDALGKIADETALTKLKSVAESGDPELAERAKKALNPPKEKPVPPGQPPDFWEKQKELERQAREDLYGRDKDRYVSVMISLVMHYAYDEDPRMVEDAKRSMGTIMAAPPKVRDHDLGIIKGLLKHKDPKVRAAAAKALEYCKGLQKEKAPDGG